MFGKAQVLAHEERSSVKVRGVAFAGLHSTVTWRNAARGIYRASPADFVARLAQHVSRKTVQNTSWAHSARCCGRRKLAGYLLPTTMSELSPAARAASLYWDRTNWQQKNPLLRGSLNLWLEAMLCRVRLQLDEIWGGPYPVAFH